MAPAIALRWFIANPDISAASEQWAFAISAKRRWTEKVRGDVRKIAESPPKPSRIYCITSQVARDKTRSELENQLAERYNISVHILDRTWIVSRVMERGHQELAIDALHIEVPRTDNPRHGPLDVERYQELEYLESSFKTPDRYRGLLQFEAEDHLRAAKIARSLEKPQYQVDNYFMVAERIAQKGGSYQQIIRIRYEWAWTCFWWFDDAESLLRLYKNIETGFGRMELASDAQLVSNLIFLLTVCDTDRLLPKKDLDIECRISAFQEVLDRISANKSDSETNARYAHLISTLLAFQYSLRDEDVDKSEMIMKIATALKQCADLPLIPVLTFAYAIIEMGEFLNDFPAYDELFEICLKIVRDRESESSEGMMLLKRGKQKYGSGRFHEALRFLGEARVKLKKDENREEMMDVLSYCAWSHSSLKLPWAARLDMLTCLFFVQEDATKEGVLPLEFLWICFEMISLELTLGRLPCVMNWIRICDLAADKLITSDAIRESYTERRINLEGVLGILFLRSDLETLESLGSVVDSLPEPEFAKACLLYALGYEDETNSLPVFSNRMTTYDKKELCAELMSQPAVQALPNAMILHSSNRQRYRVPLLGAEIVIDTPCTFPGVIVAETLAGFLEAFFATVPNTFTFTCSEIPVVLDVRPGGPFPPKVPEDDRDVKMEISDMIVKCSHISQQGEFKHALNTLVARVLFVGGLVGPSGIEGFIKHRRRDWAVEIAMHQCLPWIVMPESLHRREYLLPHWQGDRSFPLLRTQAWDYDIQQGDEADEHEERENKADEHEERENERGLHPDDFVPHRERITSPLIYPVLWDLAQWRAIALLNVGKGRPPHFGLGFLNGEAGCQVFEQWVEQMGSVDTDERIRISIVTDLDGSDAYAMVITTDPEWLRKQKHAKLLSIVSRVRHVFPAPGSTVLQDFLQQYTSFGQYGLVPCHFIAGRIHPILRLAILKKRILFRSAADIEEGDIDRVAIETYSPES